MPGRLSDRIRVPGYVPGVLALYAGMWAFFYLMCHYVPTYAGPDGVRSYNGIGLYYNVPWKAMRSVSRWPGYLVVRHGRWGTGLCIPTWLRDNEGFRAYILEHAPEDNPLRAALVGHR